MPDDDDDFGRLVNPLLGLAVALGVVALLLGSCWVVWQIAAALLG